MEERIVSHGSARIRCGLTHLHHYTTNPHPTKDAAISPRDGGHRYADREYTQQLEFETESGQP
jgi:hypothetical protein